MKIPVQAAEAEIVIQKSRFLAYLYPMTNLAALDELVKDMRKQHRKANHVCQAYRFGLDQPSGHFSDDGEPSQTAGLPMYTVLEGEDITQVAVLVVRYFGGIKLGTGGLVRAYTEAVKEVIKVTKFEEIARRQKVRLKYGYHHHNQVQRLLADVYSQEPDYQADVTWTVYLDDTAPLTDLINLTDGTIEIEELGETFIAQTPTTTRELGGHDERID